MAIFPTKKTPPPLFLILLLLLPITTPTATAIPTQMLDTVLTLLRTNSHALFANAIATSDLLFDLLSLPSATLLCPPDPQLFALDMASLSPISYISSLRSHVIPNSFLTRLITPLPHSNNDTTSSINRNATLVLHTLLPSRDLHVTRDSSSGIVAVDGVEVVLPHLYYSREVSVFRLRGVLPPDFVPAGGSTAVAPSLVVNSSPASFPAPPPAGDQKTIDDSTVGAPTQLIAPASSFAAGPGPEAGRISDHHGGYRTVAERKEGDNVEKCGALDGERRMQCAVRDGDNTRERHVSSRESDYGSFS